jgi:broad specificity phosphatase PhoE
MRLLLIRHAEPEPPMPRWSDHDRPLTSDGRHQAACLARALRERKLDRVVASTMQRAFQTAAPLASVLGIPVLPEPGLAEIALGDLADWGPDSLAEWERVTRRWGEGDFAARCPGGESLADVIGRVEPVVLQLAVGPCEHGIAIVAHAVVNGVALSTLCPDLRPALGTDLGHSHAGLWELEGDGRAFRVLRRDDTQHLAPRPAEAGG